MEKKNYQEPRAKVIEVENTCIIATSGGMEDWGNAGNGGGSLE